MSEAAKPEWSDFKDGACLGGRGTGNGTVIMDKGCSFGARVTVEEGGDHPYQVSCGVAGAVFVHSMAAESLADAKAMAESAMIDIADFLERMESDDVSQEQAILFAGVWADAFTGKFDGSQDSLKRAPIREQFPHFFNKQAQGTGL